MAYLIAELERTGIQPLVACRKDSAFSTYAQQKKWRRIELPFSNSFDLKTAWKIRRLCTQEKVSLVHIHSGKSHGIAVLSAVLGNRVPFILSRRVDFPVRSNWLTQWKYNHPQIKKIICVSLAIEKIVRQNIKKPGRCTTVHSGIDPNRFTKPSGYLRSRFSVPANAMLIGNTSALADHKDYFTFVDTAELVLKSHPETHFFIIGDGPERSDIEEYITTKDLNSRIHLTGFLNNIREVLPELDLFLMTSQTEGLGTSVLDAFACRIPVVATRAGGIPEMVKHEETGMLAAIKGSSTLAQHVLYLLNNPPVRDKITQQAHALLIQEFTHSVMAQRTLKVYQEVLST